MNTCDSCKWWTREQEQSHKYCGHPYVIETRWEPGKCSQPAADCVITPIGGISTGPKFGCVHHESVP